jgi:hypothetical protein
VTCWACPRKCSSVHNSVLQKCAERRLQDIAANGRVPVACSRRLMMVPDPTGLLQPGEIFVQLSEHPADIGLRSLSDPLRVKDASSPRMTLIRGTAVMARNPCYHPAEIAVMQAVDIEDKADPSTLAHCKRWKACLYNVVVLSAKGIVSDAQTLSGGDYDGDVAWVCWDSGIVDFIVAGSRHSSPFPDFLETHAERVELSSLADVYLFSLRDFSLGLATNTHLAWLDYFLDPATPSMDPFVKGSEPAALAALCGQIVDARKTGRFCGIPLEFQKIAYPHFLRQSHGHSRRSTSALGRMFDEGVGMALHYQRTHMTSALAADTPSKLLRIVAKNLNWWNLEAIAEHHYQLFRRQNDERSSKMRFCQTFDAAEDRARLALAYYMVSWNHVFISSTKETVSSFPWDIAYQELVDAVIRHAASAISSASSHTS